MEFLRNKRRFSFKLNGVNAWDTDYKTEYTESADSCVSVYTFADGLRITNIARKYPKYGAYEWVNYIENISDTSTGIVSDLYDCDIELPNGHENNRVNSAYMPDRERSAKIYAPLGSVWSYSEFFCDVYSVEENRHKNHIYPNETKKFACHGGRSSDLQAPFFNFHQNGAGYIFAIGWSGQWNCEIGRTNDTVTFKSKIEDTYFRVMPGEKFRTSSVVVLPYKTDFTESQNIWRRFVKEELSPLGKADKANEQILCAGIWGGMKTDSVLERIEKIKNNNLPFKYIWMDAGWYGEDTLPTPDEFEGDWYKHTGDWRVSEHVHPKKLRDVSEAVHNAGMKFLLWFEPERVIKNTPIAVLHPEYLLTDGNQNSDNLLLNLGDNKAWNYCFNTLSELIEELNIDCYRNDFNFSPLGYWRKNDSSDRCGITEIKYINGLYALWDALLEKFPKLIIDDCASGGRRIDIEMLKRSVPLWRSDMMCPANYEIEGAQCHNLTFNHWMPFSGTGTGRGYDEYRFRSAYSATLTTNHSFSERDSYCDTEEQIVFMKKYTEEYLTVQPYFSEDFYPLVQFSDKKDTWCAFQLNRPEKNDGIVEVFRREASPYETASFVLRGLRENTRYRFSDFDGGAFECDANELMKTGLKITIGEKRKAKIYRYEML